ncbi:hypothetical protein D1871_00595 [Nakamurella silvestris]|nr:hypothetical protein D1871_00595 [Nakamurella silvestris]
MFGSSARFTRNGTIGGLVAGVAALLMSAAPIASAAPVPAYQDGVLHTFTLEARSVQVHDDGDPGAFGQGDFNYVVLKIAQETNYVHLDNNTGWYEGVNDHRWEKYGSDHTYNLPAIQDYNIYYGAGAVGSHLEVGGRAREMDNLVKNATLATGDTEILIPAPGTHQDFSFQIEGTNGKSHVRMTITVRVTTS